MRINYIRPMRYLLFLLITMLVTKGLQAQVVTDTSRCGNIHKKGHLRSLLEEFKNTCLDRTKRYSFKDEAFSNGNTISFLNRSFGTKVFDSYCFLEKSSSAIRSPTGKPEMGLAMVEIGFRSEKDRTKAIAIIRSARDGYLPELELLTKFVMLREEDTIILVFAEDTYSHQPAMQGFFSKLKAMTRQYIPSK